MDKHILIDILRQDGNDAAKRSAARQLKACLTDIDVVRSLCFEAIKTDSHKLRSCIIDILKYRQDMANQCFAYIAINAKRAFVRKWALVNLSLMECTNAKKAVIQGLQDSSKSVQSAAALNIGLYHEPDFLKEVERFFNNNRTEYFFFYIERFKELRAETIL